MVSEGGYHIFELGSQVKVLVGLLWVNFVIYISFDLSHFCFTHPISQVGIIPKVKSNLNWVPKIWNYSQNKKSRNHLWQKSTSHKWIQVEFDSTFFGSQNITLRLKILVPDFIWLEEHIFPHSPCIWLVCIFCCVI